jgi:sorting nexin-8
LHWLRSRRQGKVRKDLHTARYRNPFLTAFDLPRCSLPSFLLLKSYIKTTDVSVEQVALLAQQNTLPEPTLDLSLLSYSAAPSPPSLSAAYTNNQHPSAAHNSSSVPAAAATTATTTIVRSTSISTSATIVAPPPDDPWMTGPRYTGAGAGVGATPFGVGGINGGGGGGVAPPSNVSGTGLPSGWWKRQEKVTVQFAGQQGFVLNRYMVYGISTEVRRCPCFTFFSFSLIVMH